MILAHRYYSCRMHRIPSPITWSPTVSSQSVLAELVFVFFSFWGLLFRFNRTHQEMPHLDSIQAQNKMTYFHIIFSNHSMSPPASQPAKPASQASQARQPASHPARQPASHIHPASTRQTASVRAGGRQRKLAEFAAEFLS